jgi:hypothetical protein
MAITYCTNIHQIRIDPQVANLTNVITHVQASYVATDGVNKAVMPKRFTFDTGLLDANTFIDIANVTVNTIQGWISNIFTDVADTQAMLNTQLTMAANVAQLPPWVPLGALPMEAANTVVIDTSNTVIDTSNTANTDSSNTANT